MRSVCETEMKQPLSSARGILRTATLVSVVALTLGVAGCSSRLSHFKGSLGDVNTGSREAVQPGALDDLARRYDAKPGEKRVSIAYAEALRARGQHGQAVAVLQKTSIMNVGDRDVAAAYGKALADIGKFQEAMQVLSQAHSADRPDWKVLSSQGVIADQMGEHARAREFYQHALQIAPDEPGVLTNLGLSYALTKELDKAEQMLRRAASMPKADQRVQANLDLVLDLRKRAAAPVAPVAPRKAPKSTALQAG